jgi:hypothetical protein
MDPTLCEEGAVLIDGASEQSPQLIFADLLLIIDVKIEILR